MSREIEYDKKAKELKINCIQHRYGKNVAKSSKSRTIKLEKNENL